MRILGIDEAGRGCVLGPMVVGAYLVDSDQEQRLWDLGANDSKLLTAEQRISVRAHLEQVGVATVRTITARRIDQQNLNRLEEEAIVEMVLAVRPDRIVVDALGHPNTLPATVQRLRDLVEPAVCAEWVMEPKADANHAPVAAASIFAKTTRDAALDALRERWGALGSGYPHDPITRRWLKQWSARGEPWPEFVRTRWATIGFLAQQAMF